MARFRISIRVGLEFMDRVMVHVSVVTKFRVWVRSRIWGSVKFRLKIRFRLGLGLWL